MAIAQEVVTYHSSRYQAVVSSCLILLLFHLVPVDASFTLRVDVLSFNNPSNTNASGECCNASERVGTCPSPCNISGYKLCPSRSGPNCLLLLPAGGEWNLSQTWPGGVNISISALEEAGTVVELFEFEYLFTPAQPEDTVTTESFLLAGIHKNDTSLNISLSVQCQMGFHGPSCDCQDRNDTSGHFTCTTEGGIECLEGYQNTTINCTTCVTAPGCSNIGGYCEEPGECLCHDGFSGSNCSLIDSLSTQTSPTMTSSEAPLSSMSTSEMMMTFSVDAVVPSLSSSVELNVNESVITTPTSSAKPLSMSELVITVSVMSTTVSNEVMPSPESSMITEPSISTGIIQPSVITSELSTTVTIDSTTPVDLSLSSESTDNLTPSMTTIETTSNSLIDITTTEVIETSSMQESTSIIMMSSPQPSLSSLSELSVVMTSDLSTETMLTNPSSTISIGPSVSEEPSSVSTSSSELLSTASINPSVSSIAVPPELNTSTNPIEETMSTIVSETTGESPSSSSAPSSPSTTDPTSPKPTETATTTPQSGVQVIGAAVGVIGGVVLILLLLIPVLIIITKRRRKRKKMRSALFLDEVYNSPVTLVNPGNVTITPRSPNLYIPTSSGQQGSPLDVSHKPMFPGVSYQEQAYAETGPSSDHAHSPEEAKLQQVQNTEATVIGNRHSLSTTQSPQPPSPIANPISPSSASTVSGSPCQRGSGLGFVYTDDPVGDKAYLDKQYSNDGHHGRGADVGPTPPPLPPRFLMSMTPAQRARASARELRPRRGSELGVRLTESERRSKNNEKEADKEDEEMKKRVSDYLQAALEEGEKRQSFVKDINFFTDINLDMTTQTEL